MYGEPRLSLAALAGLLQLLRRNSKVSLPRGVVVVGSRRENLRLERGRVPLTEIGLAYDRP